MPQTGRRSTALYNHPSLPLWYLRATPGAQLQNGGNCRVSPDCKLISRMMFLVGRVAPKSRPTRGGVIAGLLRPLKVAPHPDEQT